VGAGDRPRPPDQAGQGRRTKPILDVLASPRTLTRRRSAGSSGTRGRGIDHLSPATANISEKSQTVASAFPHTSRSRPVWEKNHGVSSAFLRSACREPGRSLRPGRRSPRPGRRSPRPARPVALRHPVAPALRPTETRRSYRDPPGPGRERNRATETPSNTTGGGGTSSTARPAVRRNRPMVT
jgi:hypothetical protein